MRSAAWGAPFSSNLSTVRQRETDTPSSARSTSLDDDLRARVQSIQAPASSRRTLDFTNATPSPQCSSAPTGSLTGDSSSGDEDAAPTNYLSSPVLVQTTGNDSFHSPSAGVNVTVRNSDAQIADNEDAPHTQEPSVIPIAVASYDNARSVFVPRAVIREPRALIPPTSGDDDNRLGTTPTSTRPEVRQEETHSELLPLFSPGSSKPLASNARNGRKHMCSLRSRDNTG